MRVVRAGWGWDGRRGGRVGARSSRMRVFRAVGGRGGGMLARLPNSGGSAASEPTVGGRRNRRRPVNHKMCRSLRSDEDSCADHPAEPQDSTSILGAKLPRPPATAVARPASSMTTATSSRRHDTTPPTPNAHLTAAATAPDAGQDLNRRCGHPRDLPADLRADGQGHDSRDLRGTGRPEVLLSHICTSVPAEGYLQSSRLTAQHRRW